MCKDFNVVHLYYLNLLQWHWFKFFIFKKEQSFPVSLSEPCNRQTGYQCFGFQTWQRGRPMMAHEGTGVAGRAKGGPRTGQWHVLIIPYSQASVPLHIPFLLWRQSLLCLPRSPAAPPAQPLSDSVTGSTGAIQCHTWLSGSWPKRIYSCS